MNENRDNLLHALYGIQKELWEVERCTEEMQQSASGIRPEIRAVTAGGIRAKVKQAAAALFITMPALCAVEGLLHFRIDEVVLFAVLTVLAYLFFKPERYRDKKIGPLTIVLAGIGFILLKEAGRSICRSMTQGWLAENYPVLKAALLVFWVAVTGVIAVIVYRLLSRKRDRRNQEIFEENQQIRSQNQALRETYARAERRQDAHAAQLRQICGNWFPMNYCYSYAVNSFVQFVENYQADTVKEMVNLFETAEYRRSQPVPALVSSRTAAFILKNRKGAFVPCLKMFW